MKENDLQVAPSAQREAAQWGASADGAEGCAGSASPWAPPPPPAQRPGAAHISGHSRYKISNAGLENKKKIKIRSFNQAKTDFTEFK